MKKLAILGLLVFSFSVAAFSQTPVDLDTAMKNATKEIAAKIPAKSKIAVVSFTADSAKMSEFLINGLVAELVNSTKFSVMDTKPEKTWH